MKLVYDTHENLLHTLSFFEDLEVPVLTEMVYRLKPMQLKRKVCARWNEWYFLETELGRGDTEVSVVTVFKAGACPYREDCLYRVSGFMSCPGENT